MMFPFHSRWEWYAKTGYLHLVEAIEDHLKDFASPYSEVLERRADGIRYALKVRLVVLVLLNIGLVVTAAAWIASVVPGVGELRELIQRLARLTTGLTFVFTGLFVLISRYLGQLQADIIAAIALGTGWHEESEAHRDMLIERASEETGGWSEDLELGVKEDMPDERFEQTTLGRMDPAIDDEPDQEER